MTTESIAKGAALTAESWADFVSRLRHDCVGEGTRDHCTANAVFLVQTKDRTYGVTEDYTDNKCVICDDRSWESPKAYWDDCDEEDRVDLDARAIESDGKAFIESHDSVQWDVLEELDDHRVTGWTEYWKTVNSHMTNDAAQAFINRKAHDYPLGLRVYVECTYYSWEVNTIKDAILAGKLVYAL
jgi:hypothetical protein